MAWSDVALFLGGAALGVSSCAFYYEREARLATDKNLEIADKLPDKVVAADRRLARTDAEVSQQRAQARSGGSGLSGCPVGPDDGGLLVGLALASNNAGADAGRSPVSGREVPRPRNDARRQRGD